MEVGKVSILRQSLQQATLLTKNHMLFVPVVCDTQEEWDRLQALSEERMTHYLAVAEHLETGSAHPGDIVRIKFEAYGKRKGWVHIKRKGDGYSNPYINGQWEAWQARGLV